MEWNDTVLIRLLGHRDEAAFEHVFKQYFKNLHAYACSIVQEEAAAEEIVQNIFYKIWEKAGQLTITPPVAAYLYRAVNNESINYLKHKKVRLSHREHTLYHMKGQADSASKKVLHGELEKRLRKAMNELPEQCRIIFQLSRFEELRYREIAGQLGISVKTVENQMGKALKILRTRLADFLPLLLWILLNF
jgi:RNA polymerase sigma-70 factor (ECF subfamily)